jgi:hypothetical protein
MIKKIFFLLVLFGIVVAYLYKDSILISESSEDIEVIIDNPSDEKNASKKENRFKKFEVKTLKGER